MFQGLSWGSSGKDEGGSSFQGPRLLFVFSVWLANKLGHVQMPQEGP